MKTKTISIIFIIVAVLLGLGFFASKKITVKQDETSSRAKIVTPKSSSSTNQDSEADNTSSDLQTETFDTFVTLLPTETLISALTIDFNDDGYDDEIVVVKKAGSPNFFIIPGLNVPETALYTRLDPIETNISRTRTFSYTGMDITGEHKTAIVYQGVADNGNYVMQIFHTQTVDGKLELVNIGDFSSDGTIFIQQTERSDSYALSISKGESFSVWIYESDEAMNQIQKEYNWNSTTKRYELNREIKVAASRLAAKELSRIQDGTVATFAGFLDGLWYKTSNTDNAIRYVYFDYQSKEVILLYSDTQEVYEWDDSKLRHNGIYLTTVNSDITNLHRRFNILLLGVDEIKITIQDDINIQITENTMWDGQYKKLSIQSTFDEQPVSAQTNVYLQQLEAGPAWATADSMFTLSLSDNVYYFKSSSDDSSESGIYTYMKIGNHNVIQFKSNSEASMLNPAYAIEFGTKIVKETVKKKTVEKAVIDYDTIIFVPVKITPNDCFDADGRSYTFFRSKEKTN